MSEQLDHERNHPGRHDGNGAGEGEARAQEKAERPAQGKRKLRIRVAIGAAVVLVVALLWWLHARKFEDTDDAQIDAYITAVSPRVVGTVVKVFVEDNQQVKAGDPLVELDPQDLEVALAQAKANVALAQAQVLSEQPSVAITQTTNQAQVSTGSDEVDNARADLDASQRELDQAVANAKLAHVNLERATKLLEAKTIPQSEYDQRATAAESADANVAAARQHVEQRKAKLQQAATRYREVQANAPRQLVAREATLKVRQANLELAQAQLKQAELNVGYGHVVAPVSGIVGRRQVNVGDRVQPGQQLLSITQTGDVWVTANFRETQLDNMRAGQPVEVHVDAVDRDYTGKVESFAGATGSRYSLLPPENASGNYVKVVQRIPVRIRLDPGQPGMENLRPGMSAEPKVRVR